MPINGTDGDDIIDAADGVNNGYNDIDGKGGNDILVGLGGGDTLRGGEGADYMDGGADGDTAYYDDSNAAVLVSLWQHTGIGGDAEGDTLISIENLVGSRFNDLLIGSEDVNIFFGGNGHDELKGWGGADVLFGEAGNDVLQGGAGEDILDGSFGTDTAAYGKSPAGVVVDLATNLNLYGDAEGDYFFSIENVIGSHHDDHLTGNNGDNVLEGQSGDDALKGAGGTDTLSGGGGDDYLFGGNGVDMLRGGVGDDTLDGGYGLDKLVGGDDADTFVWNHIGETSASSQIADWIWDFDAAEGDLIHLSGIDANVYAGGNQTFTFIGNAAFSGTPGEINYVYSDGITYIQMQTGTSADVEGVICLDGFYQPQASWFVL